MRLSRRIATVAAAVVLVGAVALILRSLDSMGLFAERPVPVACADAQIIDNAAGTQDMQYDAASNTVFISAASRRKGMPATRDGLYAYTPGEAGAPVKLKGTAADFHPRGISLFRGSGGSLTLVAINYPAHGNPSIDVFNVSRSGGGRIQLQEQESVSGDLLVSPSAVTAVGKDIFYVTNDHTSRSQFALALEQYLVLPWADVVYFDGASFHIVANGLERAGGINRSSDASHIYVSETMGRDIRAYSRDRFGGELSSAGTVQIDSRLANVSTTPAGELLIAGYPSLFKLSRYLGNPAKPPDSEVFRVAIDAHGNPASARLIYAGSDIAAASVALAAGHRLLIGSAFGTRILSCALPR